VSKRRSEYRNRVEFAAYRLTRTAVNTLGPRGVAGVGAVLGDLFMAVGRRRREILDFNLALAFPEMAEDERRSMAREVSRHFGRVALDSLRLQRLDPDAFMDEVTIVGEEHVNAATGLGRGILYLTAHIGLWEVAALVAGLQRAESMLVVNRPLDNPLLEDEVARFRRRFGNEPLGKRNILRAILRQLGTRGSVGILVDQRVSPSAGIEVPFFGQPAWTHTILARIVRKTRALVVPACALWQAPGQYRLEVFEPVFADELTDEELQDAPLTTRFSAITEHMIRLRPEQWLWFHDRWRELRLSRAGN
jgi:KDO2-lipid IV(A) lauroyltransferase